MNLHDLEPHAPDVLDRETSDNGFSAGWGLQMQPSVKYWIDCHTHMLETEPRNVLEATARWHDTMWAFRLRRHAAVDGTINRHIAFAAAANADDRFLWYCRLKPDQPDPSHLKQCKDFGAVGLKLHNAPLIGDAMDPKTVLSDAWHEIYALSGDLGMPIIWHVTQRLSESAYTGGGKDSYWKKGWEKGVKFSNEDLLQDFLEAVAAHPKTIFIGAHQLHLGPERLGKLFHDHPNLVADTSIGCFVGYGDRMYESDRMHWRQFVLEHSDRLLFGTDVMLDRKSAGTELLRQHFLGHLRWVRQLELPQEALSRVAHENFERIAGLQPVPPLPWGALRP